MPPNICIVCRIVKVLSLSYNIIVKIELQKHLFYIL